MITAIVSKNRSLTTLAVAALAALGSPIAAAQAPQAEPPHVAGRVLVVPRAGLDDQNFERLVREQGATRARRLGGSGVRVVEMPAGAERALLERLKNHPHVKSAELDRLVPPGVATNDPFLGSAWHLAKINAPTAWDTTLGAGVKIAILDTGVNSAHPDLAAAMLPGWNVYDNNANTADVHGHGTQVAGTAAAAANNALGVAGVAGGAKIVPVRISDPTGWASFSAMAAGLTWAADNGARVANISYVAAGSSSVQSAATYFKSKGGLVTTAAGNYGTDAGIAPTSTMIPVSSTNVADAKSSFSSFGSFVAMSAPGEGIYTTVGGSGYGAVSGTSFASPVTAGVIGLMMAARPTLPAATIESLLYSSAVDFGAAGRDPVFGHGRVNAGAAVAAALASGGPAPDTAAPTVAITSPVASSSVSGLVAVNVSASDNVGVAKVELLVNGQLLAADTAAPYQFSWDSTKAANGMSTLVARALDAAGNSANSASVAVNVANPVADTVAPTVSFTSPTASTRIFNVVKISVAASDNRPAGEITQKLFINGTQVASATGATLEHNWNVRKLPVGSYTLRAEARDAAGNVAATTLTVNR